MNMVTAVTIRTTVIATVDLRIEQVLAPRAGLT